MAARAISTTFEQALALDAALCAGAPRAEDMALLGCLIRGLTFILYIPRVMSPRLPCLRHAFENHDQDVEPTEFKLAAPLEHHLSGRLPVVPCAVAVSRCFARLCSVLCAIVFRFAQL